MSDDGDGVRVQKMQCTEPAEGKHDGPQPCRIASNQMPSQKQLHPKQHEGIAQQNFKVEGRCQRQTSIQQIVQRMIRAALACACQKEATEEIGHPVEGVCFGEAIGIELPNGEMVILQIIADVDSPREDGQEHPRQHGKRCPLRHRRLPRFLFRRRQFDVDASGRWISQRNLLTHESRTYRNGIHGVAAEL